MEVRVKVKVVDRLPEAGVAFTVQVGAGGHIPQSREQVAQVSPSLQTPFPQNTLPESVLDPMSDSPVSAGIPPSVRGPVSLVVASTACDPLSWFIELSARASGRASSPYSSPSAQPISIIAPVRATYRAIISTPLGALYTRFE